MFICSNYNRNGKDSCSRHSIREDDLNEIVLEKLQGYINSMCDCEKVLVHLGELNVNYDEAVAHDKEIVALKAELTRFSALKSALYQDLKLFIDMWVDSRKIVDMQREKQAKRMALEEKHLLDMEKSYERINKDLRDAYESYKHGMTDRETYLEQRKTYKQLLVRMQENIEKQKVAVSKMAAMDVPEVAGVEMLDGQMKLQN